MIRSMLISEPQRCWLPLFQVFMLLQAKLTGSWILLHIPKVASTLLSDCFHARKQISILPQGIPSTRLTFCSLIPLKSWYISLFKHGDMALQNRIWFPIRTMVLITSSSKMQVLLSVSADTFKWVSSQHLKKRESVNRSSSSFQRSKMVNAWCAVSSQLVSVDITSSTMDGVPNTFPFHSQCNTG